MKKQFFSFIFVLLAAISLSAQTPQQADSLHRLGRAMLEQGNIVEGRQYTKQAMDMRKKLFGEVNEDYITSLHNYAFSFTLGENPDLDQAIKLELQVMKLCGKLKKPHPQFALYALNMGRLYYFKEDYDNAAKYWEQALAAAEKYGEMYESLLEWLGMIYADKEDVKNMERIMALMEDHNQHELQKPCEEAKCMLERGQYYAASGDNARAKIWFQKALDNAEGAMKVQVLEEYARYAGMDLGDFVTAAEYIRAAVVLQKELKGETEKYASLSYKAGVYSFLGEQYPQAVECYRQAMAFYQKSASSTAAENIAKCQKGMGNAYSALHDYAHAKECHRQEVAYYEQYDRGNEEYPEAILRLAKAEKFNKDYPESIEHHQLAMRLFEERGMSEAYSSAAASLKLCYIYAGDTTSVDVNRPSMITERNQKLDKIIQEETTRLQMTRTYSGKLSYARSLSTIAGCYALKEEYVRSISYYQQYMTAVREAVREAFRTQSETERMITWNKETRTLQDIKNLFFKLQDVEEKRMVDDVNALVYDAALLSKGILLNSSIEFEKVLREKGDQELLAVYAKTKANQAEIERLRTSSAGQADLDKILQLSQENQNLQAQLNQRCAEMADFTSYISYTWKDVQNSLQNSDVAIEFVECDVNVFDKDNFIFALVLTKEMESPVAVAVADLKMVKEMAVMDSLYVLDGNPIWGKLRQYLSGRERIFFSADGGFNHVGIEYLLYEGKPLSEQFKVYRLSSTKELCYRRQAQTLDYVVLFGDINYNEFASVTSAGQQQVVAMRGGKEFGTLLHTKMEINEIQHIVKNSGVKMVVKISDVDASRDAFLELDGSKVNMIHVATHGAYVESSGSTDRESMSNSFLAFAGANLSEEGSNYGKVTAADIADMNLRQCNLVVLSACETGLGKLSGDGVFGLQRGFKNAGVHTLLMSLKKVYDESTAELMIRFYRHLVHNGGNKREALVAAQKELRAMGFTDAKYWATFILLDADF